MGQVNKTEDRKSVIFSSDGQKIFAVLHLPLMQTNCPAVAICHGFGGNKAGRFRYYVKLAEELTKLGIAALRFDFRGSGDSEGNPGEMDLSGHVDDAHCAIEYLKQQSAIDNQRLGILGRSLGGAIAVKTAAQRNDLKAIALWVPLFSGSKWQEKWARHQNGGLPLEEKKELRYFNGQMPSKEFLKQFFALDLAKDLKQLSHTPLLHMHAGQDTIIDAKQKELYIDGRKNAQAKTEMRVFHNQDHELRNSEELQQMIEETCKWFEENL